jgi:hypothetical protein
LGGYYQITNSNVIEQLGLNSKQLAVWNLIRFAAWATRPYALFSVVGDEMLLARGQLASVNFGISGNLYSGSGIFGSGLYVSAPLSDKQWQLEAEQIFNIGLANMQHILASRAAGDLADDILYNSSSFIVRPNTDAEKALCFQQKIRSPQHGSFSVVGIFIILLVGILIMAIRFSLFQIANYWRKKCKSRQKQQRLKTWTEMDILYLISFVLPGGENISWEYREENIPVTRKREKMRWDPYGLANRDKLLGENTDNEEK